MFENVKVGARAIRCVPAAKNDRGHETAPPFEQEGQITDVKEDTIRGMFKIFGNRRAAMEFSRQTGISVNGPEYGTLQVP